MNQLTEDDPIETGKKFCPECKKEVETYWELCFCDKNPEGLSENLISHGNIINGMSTCEDDYCSPDDKPVEPDDQKDRAEYIRTHEVVERCGTCHGFWEEMA